jgi:chorismate mutase / prephenate dehydratase
MEIEVYRKRIDELDRELVRLMNERAECARRIGEAKHRDDQAAYAPDRERQVLERVLAANSGPLSKEAVLAIYRELISACRGLERAITVAYWGPPASNTHVAARQRFGAQVEFLPTGSVEDVFLEVERGEAHFGVIPIENSTEGVVTSSLDQFLHRDLQVCAEIYVPIQHNLLSNAGSIQELRRVYTMFQATAQCRNWIGTHLSHVELVDTTTTAKGAELASRDPEAGAIANLAAAEHYGLGVLAPHIEDNARNHTRFWVIGRLQPAPSGRDKTSILFSVPHQPGGLIKALTAFENHGVSLSFIESRPTKQTPWEYVFFVDVQGHVATGDDTPLQRALTELRQQSLFCRVLGSYPEAE